MSEFTPVVEAITTSADEKVAAIPTSEDTKPSAEEGTSASADNKPSTEEGTNGTAVTNGGGGGGRKRPMLVLEKSSLSTMNPDGSSIEVRTVKYHVPAPDTIKKKSNEPAKKKRKSAAKKSSPEDEEKKKPSSSEIETTPADVAAKIAVEVAN